jgi:hypothetical protein
MCSASTNASHVLEHRHFDRLALAGPPSLDQRRHDALGRDEADHVIGEHYRHVACLAAGAAVAVGDAGHALDDGVVGGPVAVAPVLAEAHQVADDEPAIALAQGLRAETQALQRRWPHIGDEDIGGAEQAVQRGEGLLLLEVEHDRPFVAVEVHELARQFAARGLAAERAQQVAGWRLHLDDVGAVVGKVQRGGRPDHDGGQVDHTDAAQRTAAHCSASVGAASASVSST